MALLDYLYFVGSPENKKCSPHKWRAKENREISNLLIFTYVGKHLLCFLVKTSQTSRILVILSCLKPTVFGFPQFRALEPCL
jgi:hypothetical protein